MLGIVSFEEDNALSREEILSELEKTRSQLTCSEQGHFQLASQLSASNAHCTMSIQEYSTVRLQLDNVTKRKKCRSKKIKAWWVTSRGHHAQFEAEDTARIEKECMAAEKHKQKEAETTLQECQVADNALNREFTGQISSYKKNDLRALSIALEISDKRTNADLSSQIKDHFDQHPDTWENPRFAGLIVTNCASQKSSATQVAPHRHGQLTGLDEGLESDATTKEALKLFLPCPPNGFVSSSSHHTTNHAVADWQYIYDPQTLNTFDTLFQGHYIHPICI
jgi:hypothetical protein